jgi:hypothetical protein
MGKKGTRCLEHAAGSVRLRDLPLFYTMASASLAKNCWPKNQKPRKTV